MISTIRNTLIVANVSNLVAIVERLVKDKALYVKYPTIILATTAPIMGIERFPINNHYSNRLEQRNIGDMIK